MPPPFFYAIFFTGEKHIIKGDGYSIRKQEILFIFGKYTEKDSTSFLFFSDYKNNDLSKRHRQNPRISIHFSYNQTFTSSNIYSSFLCGLSRKFPHRLPIRRSPGGTPSVSNNKRPLGESLYFI